MWNKQKYVTYLENKSEQWKQLGYELVYITPGPVSQSYKSISNVKVQQFSNHCIENLSSYQVFDLFTYLANSGFKTVDGLHYNDYTYNKIFKFVKGSCDYYDLYG